MIDDGKPTRNEPTRIASWAFFCASIVCGLIAMWIFGGKMPAKIGEGSVWGYFFAAIAVISSIAWRGLWFARSRGDDATGADEKHE